MVVTDPVDPAQKTVISPSVIPDFPQIESTWDVMSIISQKPLVFIEIVSVKVINQPQPDDDFGLKPGSRIFYPC